MANGFIPLGMYPHSPTGEYRLLLYLSSSKLVPHAQPGCYILSVGSGQLPRHIGCRDVERLINTFGSVMFHGSLHWHRHNVIMVFDTITELFHEMSAPVVPGPANLFEMHGMLAASIFSDPTTSIDIWIAQDYANEVWAFKYRVNLPVAELTAQFGKINKRCCVVFASCDGHVLVLAKFGDWLLQVDMDGKLVASFHRRGVGPTQNRLKQSLVRHTFFPTLEDGLAGLFWKQMEMRYLRRCQAIDWKELDPSLSSIVHQVCKKENELNPPGKHVYSANKETAKHLKILGRRVMTKHDRKRVTLDLECNICGNGSEDAHHATSHDLLFSVTGAMRVNWVHYYVQSHDLSKLQLIFLQELGELV
uniref:F-box associated domain-containing protein n=1 Tax=Aegilops tauschii TaxID=37682 RepID=M8BN41_AEGTA